MNIMQWKAALLSQKAKKAMPILSFPGTKLIGCTVEEIVRDSHLQALCMKSIAEKYDMAAAVSLMDLSVESEAFGSKILFDKNEVPSVIDALIHDMDEAQALRIPQIGAGRTGVCVEGIREACELITDRPVFAGIIGPFSLSGRLLDLAEIMIFCYEEPEMVKTVLEKATAFLTEYALAFKKAGADGIIMAEPAAGLLSPDLIEEFSNPYVNRICEAVEDESFMVLYHNCGNVIPLADKIKEIKVQAYSFGNAIDLQTMLEKLPADRMIIGNVDPAGVLCNGTPESVRKETLNLMECCAKHPNFVPASGCDIPPKTPFENLDAFFSTINEYYCCNSEE